MPASLALTGTVWLLAGLLAGTMGGIVAPRKRRHAGFWTTASFLFPPMVLVLLLLPVSRAPHPLRHRDLEWDPPDNLDYL